MQMLMQPSPATEPSPGPGEVDIRPFVSIVGELEAAQSVLDNANYSLANALALDDSPASTPDTNFLEQQLVQAAELGLRLQDATFIRPPAGDDGGSCYTGDRSRLDASFDRAERLLSRLSWAEDGSVEHRKPTRRL